MLGVDLRAESSRLQLEKGLAQRRYESNLADTACTLVLLLTVIHNGDCKVMV